MDINNFDLRELNNFNKLDCYKKKNILLFFNLNKYKFILHELKNIYCILDRDKDKDKVKKKITKLFREGCLNINIINSNHICNIYIGGIYYLYFNKTIKKYYLYILKKKNLDLNNEEFIGQFKLNNDLIWKKVLITTI